MLPRVLVIEDDGDLRRLLRRGLEEEGFDVVQASLGKDGVALAEADPPDLMVIDIGLPDAECRDSCQAIRSTGIGSPVLFLTAGDQMVDRLAGFSAGGDDSLTKPFEFAELIARLRALLRRSSGATRAVEAGDLRLDLASHAASSGGKTIALTPTEFRLL